MLGPLPCLVIGIASILVLMLYFRFHAFLALISAAIITAVLSDRIPIENSLPLVAAEFGNMMANIGILLVMAAIIGKCLMDSGAADRIVRAFTRLFGAGREHYSLLASGFVLSIPVFFDTVFYLLAPLARAVFARRKTQYVLIICATAAGGALTHALVPPTPGPLIVTEQLAQYVPVTIGMSVLVGILVAAVPAIVGGVFYANWIDRRLVVTPKDALGVSQKELEATALKPDHELPGLTASLVPFMLPVILLAGTSIALPYIPKDWQAAAQPAMRTPAVADSAAAEAAPAPVDSQKVLIMKALKLFGDKNLSFFLGAVIAIRLLIRQKKLNYPKTMELLEPAIASGAMIAFITCAGGSFGKVLAASGVGDVIGHAAREWGLSMLLFAFLTSSLIRIAQGSATVAMITTAGIIGPTLPQIALPYHPVYLIMAIGFGASGYSWMNDSGFWIFGQLTGLSEAETLKTWTAMLTLMAFVGMVWVYVLTKILPLV
ncbi:MAG: GntP family permease [bacterium]